MLLLPFFFFLLNVLFLIVDIFNMQHFSPVLMQTVHHLVQ